MMNKSPGRGRRTGSPDTRAQILEAARRRFLAQGYRAVTLRAVAAEAGVDVALVSYFFGSKKGLFGAAMALSANPAEALVQALEGDWATLPERAIRTVLAFWGATDTGSPLRAMLSGATQDPALATLVKEVVEREMIEKVAARIGGVDAHKRAGAFCSHMGGLILTRFILRLEPVASMHPDEIVRLYTPALRTALFEPGRRTVPAR
jgi:AcrR family transcriptional regulator